MARLAGPRTVPPHLEIWGGVESTIARVGDDWRDQVHETGHDRRDGDLDLLASLGIAAVRYPALWESLDPGHAHHRDWAWHDRRLEGLRERGIRPIVGLVHHGSGPRGTSLVDPDFPVKLARFAGEAARRWPWITDWTPVNEPLTTARFSCLYGHWYPHARDTGSFHRALVAQCKAVVLSMEAIRREIPDARLIQTEDLGKTFSTPRLAYQAEFENERRFLSFDLLAGRVGPDHPLHGHLTYGGVDPADLEFLEARAVPPDVLGMNHYLTSERFLDERIDLYPSYLHGGNGRDSYADAEAVRAGAPEADLGPEARLRDLWERYGRPVAITEAHHGCSREEQLRWLAECHGAAVSLRSEGADVRAVTAWALFGVVDWSSLLTVRMGHYEPGAFDARHDPPRPTALAHQIRRLAGGAGEPHPVLLGDGWWRRPARLYSHVAPPAPAVRAVPRRLLLLGDPDGAIGRGIDAVASVRGLDAEWRPGPGGDVAADLRRGRYWAVVDVRAITAPAAAIDPVRPPEATAVPWFVFSTGKVFDGSLDRAYVESDPARPACPAGESLAALERSVLDAVEGALVVRAGPVQGTDLADGPIGPLIAALAAAAPPPADWRARASFSYLPDLVHAALDLGIDGAAGLWHLVNEDADSWPDIVRRTGGPSNMGLDMSDGSEGLVPHREPVLVSERARLLPGRESVLGRCVAEVRARA